MKPEMGSGRPKTGYFASTGEEVPGTTTIIYAMESRPVLIDWAVGLALKGVDHKEVRDKSAAIGHMSHDCIHALVSGEPAPTVPSELLEPVTARMEQFQPWLDKFKPELLLAEVPMVSDAHMFGGTPDLVANIGGKVTMVDYKTSNTGPYASWFAQLGAYCILYKERHDVFPEQGCVVHVSERRKNYKGYWVTGGQLQFCADHFLGLLKEYNRRKTIESWFKRKRKSK